MVQTIIHDMALAILWITYSSGDYHQWKVTITIDWRRNLVEIASRKFRLGKYPVLFNKGRIVSTLSTIKTPGSIMQINLT